MFQKISDILREQLKKENVKVFFTRGRTIHDLICNNKPKIPRERSKNKVYQIPCKDCKKIYIGETSQWFDERESQHKRAVSNKDTTNGIAQHVYETSHIINWEKAELIDSHKYQQNRFFFKKKLYQCFYSWKWRFWMLDEPRYGNKC